MVEKQKLILISNIDGSKLFNYLFSGMEVVFGSLLPSYEKGKSQYQI